MQRFVFVALLLGCRNEEHTIRADRVHVDAGPDAPADVVVEDVFPPTAFRAPFDAIALNVSEHGLDGVLELWRDPRLDDKTLSSNWFDAFEDYPPAGFTDLQSAQLILRDAHGRIVESFDLERALARLKPIRLGDDRVPYVEVSIDTYDGVGRWGFTTHRFARVEAGHTKWLECATSHDFAHAGTFSFDPRPSGGHDILAWSHDIVTTGPRTTTLQRLQIQAGACNTSATTVRGWLGAHGEPPAPSRSAFPPRF